MTAIDPSPATKNQRGSKGSRMSLGTLTLWTNAAFFIFSSLAVAASIVVFLVARAGERQKDRELERYKASAQASIAKANEGAEQARADAAAARLETARISAGLLQTQVKLNAANTINEIPLVQLRLLTKALASVKVGDAVVILAAGPSKEARYKAYEIDHAVTKAGITRPYGEGVQEAVDEPGDTGDIQIWYAADDYKPTAAKLVAAFQKAGFVTSLKVTPPSADPAFLVEEKRKYIWIIVVPRKPSEF